MTSYTFDQLLDFTRTSSATFVGSNGLIQTTAASRNLLTFTQQFDNAAWTKTNMTVTANSTTAPDGTSTADTLTATAGTGVSVRVSQSGTTINATVYIASFYVRPGTHTFVQLHINAQTADWCNFTLTGSGSVQNNGAAIGAISFDSATGYYRISITYTAGGTDRTPFFGLVPSGTATRNQTWNPVGTETVFIWGAQLEAASAATTYTRNNGGVFPPRFDYNPVTLAPKGLLIEEQRTNLTLQSGDFTVSPWAAALAGTSTRSNTDTALGFMRGLVTATSALGGIRQTYSGLTSGQVYALSFYVQSAATSLVVTLENGTSSFGSPHTVTLNPSTGTAGTPTGYTSVTSTPFGSGYVYTLITAAAGGTLIANFEWRLSTSGTSMLYGRPQLEAGAFATSYIPTVASQVTRTADQCSIVAPNFASWYNQSEGTFVFEGDSSSLIGYPYAVLASDGSFNNRFGAYRSLSSVAGLVVSSNVTQMDISASSVVANVPFKVAVAAQANNGNLSLNGSIGTNDTTITMPTVNRLSLASGPSGASDYLNGHIRSIRYYPVRLSNTQLQALTA